MNLKDYIGKPTGAGRVHIERGAVSRFAAAVTDESAVYSDLDAATDAGFDAPPGRSSSSTSPGARRPPRPSSARSHARADSSASCG